jgi:demethylmenaquinone methyltransferase/2-methoxy-6-polyprenyl-1,4-benzoquinol methylase
MMSPSLNKKLIDVACGTGDIGKLFLDNTDKHNEITCVDPNKGMIDQGKQKLSKYKNIKWVISYAEKLPFEDNTFDFYTIGFGLRNTKNLDKTISEAYRVLRPGGRFLCLEFSKIQNSNLNFIYKNYSKLIPIVGEFVVGQKEPYEYLIKSIEEFINQEELIDLMKKNKLQKCTYRNFSGGIVSIHSGWKF